MSGVRRCCWMTGELTMRAKAFATFALLTYGLIGTSSAINAQQRGKIPRIGVIGGSISVSSMRTNSYKHFIAGLRDLGRARGADLNIARGMSCG